MSDFPEKTPETGEEIPEEESTVFSAPQAHKKTAPDKKKRLLPVVLAAVLAVAVLAGGTFAVIKLIPEKKTDDGQSLPVPETKTVILIEETLEELKTVTVKNPNGTFRLYAEQQDQTVTWYAEGYEKEKTATDALAEIAGKAAKVEVLEKEVQVTAEYCELDDQHAVTLDVEKKDGTTYSFRIGKESMDETGTYLALSGDEKIYIATSPTRNDFVFDKETVVPGEEPEAKVDLPEVPSEYIDANGALTFDKLTLSGENFPEAVVIKPNTDSTISQFAAFVITEPDERMADKVDDLLVLYTNGITYDAVYSESATAAELQKYGLDKPDLKVETVFGAMTITHRFKKQADGNYAVFREGTNRILSVAADSIPYAEYGATHYYAKWIFMQSINDLSGFTVKSKDESYTFSIQYNGDEADEKYVIKVGDKKITADYFQEYYQECLMIPSVDFVTVETTAEPEYTLILTYSDSSRSPLTVEFTPISETRYQYSVNKKPMGQVSATKLSSLMTGAAKVAKDQSIK